MSREAGSCQWESTRPIAWRGLVVEGTAWDPDIPSWRDSTKKRAAKPATRSASAAAPSHGAQAGHGREPAQTLRALLGRRGIGHVRLHHADSAAAQPLHETAEEQHQ